MKQLYICQTQADTSYSDEDLHATFHLNYYSIGDGSRGARGARAPLDQWVGGHRGHCPVASFRLSYESCMKLHKSLGIVCALLGLPFDSSLLQLKNSLLKVLIASIKLPKVGMILCVVDGAFRAIMLPNCQHSSLPSPMYSYTIVKFPNLAFPCWPLILLILCLYMSTSNKSVIWQRLPSISPITSYKLPTPKSH